MEIEQIWKGLTVEKELGQGSYGTVYSCVHNINGQIKRSAVKVISVPQSDIFMQKNTEGMTLEETREYYRGIVSEFQNEIKLLESLKNAKNIVKIEDSRVIEKENRMGWKIFIKMELLTDFSQYVSMSGITEEDVVRLGCDLCGALKICHSKKIIHRDIKPENIFVDGTGSFKLGDFGVAKQLEKTESSLSRKGTYNYMAPEVFNATHYDARADIYSLGLVMYKLLNGNRLPFIPTGNQFVMYHDKEKAFERRIHGEPLPDIPGINPNLNLIIKKACAFNPNDRFSSAEEFVNALLSYRSAGFSLPKSSQEKDARESKIKIAAIGVAAVLIIAIIAGTTVMLLKDNDTAVPIAEMSQTTQTTTETTKQKDDSYIFPSDTEAIPLEFVQGMSLKELNRLLNEIYARHGFVFTDPDLKEYFESKSWYKATNADDEAVRSEFNDMESKNLNFLANYRKAHFE